MLAVYVLIGMLFFFSQENVKTKHPQLLYESKLYKVLQGGSKDFSYVLVYILQYVVSSF